jgi:hypothetical protein
MPSGKQAVTDERFGVQEPSFDPCKASHCLPIASERAVYFPEGASRRLRSDRCGSQDLVASDLASTGDSSAIKSSTTFLTRMSMSSFRALSRRSSASWSRT